MVLVCFLLDLCSLSPSLVGDLKQLANFYAVSSPSRNQSESLRDRIGLCYLLTNRISSSDELTIAYNPRGDFSLRDFHHAVNSLPSFAFSPEINDSVSLCCCDVKLSSLLCDEVLYTWGSKDIMRKVIVLSSRVPKSFDSSMKKILMDAADKCVSVEFVLLEQRSSHLGDIREKINDFISCISDLDNCSFQSFLPDVKVLNGLVKRWLLDMKDDMEEPLQACFIFKDNLISSVKQISCTLLPTINHIADGFDPCQTCRCHGIPLRSTVKTKTKGSTTCSVTGLDLGTVDVIENSVKVGENTILFMPSFHSSLQLRQVASSVNFHIIERTNLGSLSEGVIFGDSYIVIPSTSHEMEALSDKMDQPELNAQIFQGVCRALHSLDQGLICFSDCNTQTMREAAFHCYYILQPSENGPMLLRRLAGSEEVLPTTNANKFVQFSISKEIEISIQTSLVKLDSRDYNPILHERGFHRKLNSLAKESLQFGSIPSKWNEAASEAQPVQLTAVVLEDDTPELDQKEEKTTASIAEEWEQLVVSEAPRKYSPSCTSKTKLDQSLLSPSDINKQLDVKTTRILERLEIPRQLRSRVHSPTISGSSISDACFPVKKPLIPFQASQTGDEACTSSQLMKPNFQRLKRKHR